MAIQPIQGIGALTQTGGAAAPKPAAGFADMLGNALNQLQGISDNANSKVNALATGKDVDISDVMLSLESESLSMSMVTQVRNKAVEAYQEVFRMQM
jgi:flagellar hook-basal body complex protein FliE